MLSCQFFLKPCRNPGHAPCDFTSGIHVGKYHFVDPGIDLRTPCCIEHFCRGHLVIFFVCAMLLLSLVPRGASATSWHTAVGAAASQLINLTHQTWSPSNRSTLPGKLPYSTGPASNMYPPPDASRGATADLCDVHVPDAVDIITQRKVQIVEPMFRQSLPEKPTAVSRDRLK